MTALLTFDLRPGESKTLTSSVLRQWVERVFPVVMVLGSEVFLIPSVPDLDALVESLRAAPPPLRSGVFVYYVGVLANVRRGRVQPTGLDIPESFE